MTSPDTNARPGILPERATVLDFNSPEVVMHLGSRLAGCFRNVSKPSEAFSSIAIVPRSVNCYKRYTNKKHKTTRHGRIIMRPTRANSTRKNVVFSQKRARTDCMIHCNCCARYIANALHRFWSIASTFVSGIDSISDSHGRPSCDCFHERGTMVPQLGPEALRCDTPHQIRASSPIFLDMRNHVLYSER